MSSRSTLALLPALLCLAYACGTKVLPSGLSSATTTSSSTAAGTGGATAATAQSSAGPVTTAVSTSTGGAGAGGGSALCTMQEEMVRWQSMLQAPIALMPSRAANLDLAGPKGIGLTIPEAEQINCPCNSAPGEGGAGGASGVDAGPLETCSWGDDGQVWADDLSSKPFITLLHLYACYAGTLGFKSRDGQHTYSIPIDAAPIQKDGAPFLLAWSLPGFNTSPQLDAEINEIHDALIATFAPDLPQDMSCQTSEKCALGDYVSLAYLYFDEVGLGLWIASGDGGQPAVSTVDHMDLSGP
jgi:hypothetical protein